EVASVRKYPIGEVMAHVIGYMGEISQEELTKDLSGEYSFGDYLGKFGLEKEIGRFLKGRDGAEQAEVNAFGKEVKVLGRLEPVAGYNAVLTINLSLQQAAWNALEGKAGAVVVMDPRDGAILAMVSSPSFDPNLFSEGIPREVWRKLMSNPLHPMENRAITGQYPPASTYKVIVAAAALEAGLVGPDTVYTCNGEYEMGNRTFRCWRREGHGRVNLHRAIVESCDVYFYNLGKLIGVDTIATYARHFGLGEKTGIDLPQEKKGRVPTKKWKRERFKEQWHPGETIPISIGQGYNLTTPLQLANVYSALANGGTLYRPRIVKRLLHGDGRVYQEYPPEVISKLPVSEKTIQTINRALWGVVNEPNGTGSALRRVERDVSGKTGTAQVVQLARKGETMRYKVSGRRLKDHAMFVCFAPSERPEIVVAVLLEHAGAGGGAVAAPIARKIVDAYFNK
ncbi:MAG: penicillin-binding protein 2, partial [Smithellaceae bacterium]|nr:penicillin-binding protein 2 [Smithellaceae bacterium]